MNNKCEIENEVDGLLEYINSCFDINFNGMINNEINRKSFEDNILQYVEMFCSTRFKERVNIKIECNYYNISIIDVIIIDKVNGRNLNDIEELNELLSD